MLWFTVWTVLVVATLGGAYLLGRRLWRSLTALGEELARASDVAHQVGVRAAELEALARAAQTATRPALGADADALRERVELLRAARRERVAARSQQHRTTVADATSRWFG